MNDVLEFHKKWVYISGALIVLVHGILVEFAPHLLQGNEFLTAALMLSALSCFQHYVDGRTIDGMIEFTGGYDVVDDVRKIVKDTTIPITIIVSICLALGTSEVYGLLQPFQEGQLLHAPYDITNQAMNIYTLTNAYIIFWVMIGTVITYTSYAWTKTYIWIMERMRDE